MFQKKKKKCFPWADILQLYLINTFKIALHKSIRLTSGWGSYLFPSIFNERNVFIKMCPWVQVFCFFFSLDLSCILYGLWAYSSYFQMMQLPAEFGRDDSRDVTNGGMSVTDVASSSTMSWRHYSDVTSETIWAKFLHSGIIKGLLLLQTLQQIKSLMFT